MGKTFLQYRLYMRLEHFSAVFWQFLIFVIYIHMYIYLIYLFIYMCMIYNYQSRMEIEGCEIILGLSLILHAILDIYRHSDIFSVVACRFWDK